MDHSETFHALENGKTEITHLKCLKTLLEHDIQSIKLNTEEVCRQLEEARWKIRRTEFVSFYEKTKQENNLQNATVVVETLQELDKILSSEEIQVKKKQEKVSELHTRKEILLGDLKQINSDIESKKRAMADTQQDVLILGKRISAIMKKLEKDKQSVEKQEQMLISKLKNLDNCYQSKVVQLRRFK